MADDISVVVSKVCSEDGCEKPVLHKGLCVAHYSRALYNRNPKKFNARTRAWRARNRKQLRATQRAWRLKNIVHVSLHNHIQCITNPKNSNHSIYKGYPIYPAWDFRVSGRYQRGAALAKAQKELIDGAFFEGVGWVEGIGERPKGVDKNGRSLWSLHIVEKKLGLWPGNLIWATRDTQVQKQRHKELANAEHAHKKAERLEEENKLLKQRIAELELVAA